MGESDGRGTRPERTVTAGEPPSATLSASDVAPPKPSSGALSAETPTPSELSRPPPSSAAPVLPPRYRDIGRIASGGFGEVRRVFDTALDRVVAMKVLHADIAARPKVAARFLSEVKLTAGLAHPGIVAVHDWGRLDDGRLWFTMREVRGRTLGEVIDEVHAAADDDGFHEAPSGWTFRRLVDAFARVCQAVAYAHRRGIVHRDLKPDNVMVGELGEVLVMDWGLGRRVTDESEPAEPSVEAPASDGAPQLTRHGDVLGTPAYMPPEQALGMRELHGPPSDVYALGAILYHVLAGRPPYRGGVATVLAQVIAGSPAPIAEAALPRRVPEELASICTRAMRRPTAERYPDAEVLAVEVVAWLDGARRREQALAVVERARAMEPEITSLRARTASLRAEAAARLEGVRPFDPVEQKQPGWALEDEAAGLDAQAALREAEWLEALHGALTVDPELPEAHAALADHYREQLLSAEREHRDAEAVRAEALLRAHDQGRHAALLRGDGALSLVTDPPGAEVFCERYVEQGRRLVPEPWGPLGRTPLERVVLPHGSYRLRVRSPGRAEVVYPVLIERAGRWDGRPPDEDEPSPILLPAEGELDPDEVYVPAGAAWIGGDPRAGDSLPWQRIWIDAFILKRFAVTNEDYRAFLNDLVHGGREADAIAACPRAQLGMGEERMVFVRGGGGEFMLGDDHLGRPLLRDAPVTLVDWLGAAAYARWLAKRTGKAWRLLNELEREKAARGVDGRLCPAGYHVDAQFLRCVESVEKNPAIVSVHDDPADESPYGARGLGGNSRDWCENAWRRDGPRIERGRLVREVARGDGVRAVRGGSWSSPLEFCRSATRFGNASTSRRLTIGLRLARSYEPRESVAS